MRLFLVRHAHAVDEEENPDRPLSHRGRAQVARLVDQFRALPEITPKEIWHSPLIRSAETAKLLAAGLMLTAPLIEKANLQPEDDPSALLQILAQQSNTLMIVGHEPCLGLLAAWLVDGQPTERFGLKKAGVIALERTGATWSVQWTSEPGQMEG